MLTIGVTAAIAAGAAASIVALANGHSDASLAARQASVHEHGAMVMPFDLTKTTHTFRDTASGGIETVIAKSPSDTAQVDLARGHLRQEAEKFATGNFSDPIASHGPNMPGVAALSAGAARIHFDYANIPAGARITYSTADPALRQALHTWFAAQLRDHGNDAMP